MTKPERSSHTLRLLSIGAGLLLPTLTLVPLGSLWLWQRGLLLYWAIAATLLVAIAYFVQGWLFPQHAAPTGLDQAAPASDAADASPEWTPAEVAAWGDVLAVAQRADAARITSQQEALALAFQTIEAVARKLHPEVREPVWQFTVPEAFAMLERVSTRLGTFVYDHVPLSDRLTVAQAMSLYRWRGSVEAAQKAYDVWRLVRIANPLAAVTGEIRERLSKQMMQWGREHLTRQLTEVYVKEVGRAAIDLYGGRLSLGKHELDAHVTSASRADLDAAANRALEPLRIMVVGQTSAGKSSLVNALAGEIQAAVDALPTTSAYVPYALNRSGLPAALIIDSPGLEPDLGAINDLVQRSAECDLVLWVAAANAADRSLDHRAINGFRERFAATANRRRPPMLLVLTHIDRLRPFMQWAPPYDLTEAAEPKVASILSAVLAASADLGFAQDDVIPVSLAADSVAFNVDALWTHIVALLPEAARAQLLRQLQDLKSGSRLGRLWTQTANAGAVLGKTLWR